MPSAVVWIVMLIGALLLGLFIAVVGLGVDLSSLRTQKKKRASSTRMYPNPALPARLIDVKPYGVSEIHYVDVVGEDEKTGRVKCIVQLKPDSAYPQKAPLEIYADQIGCKDNIKWLLGFPATGTVKDHGETEELRIENKKLVNQLRVTSLQNKHLRGDYHEAMRKDTAFVKDVKTNLGGGGFGGLGFGTGLDTYGSQIPWGRDDPTKRKDMFDKLKKPAPMDEDQILDGGGF